ELVAVHQRVGGAAPVAELPLEVLREVLRPDHLAGVGVEAKQVAHGAEGVDLAVLDRRGGARPGGVADLIGAVVLVLPEDLAVVLVEAQDALLAVNALAGETAGGVLDALRQAAVDA